MGIREGTIAVLQEAGESLHAKEIAKRLLVKKLWATEGKTPHATVSARLYADIKKHGDASPFIHAGPQTFALRPGASSPGSVEKPAGRGRTKKAVAAPAAWHIIRPPFTRAI